MQTLKSFRLRLQTLECFKLRCRTKEDRISSLPDELIIRILGSLPTKDGAALGFTSQRMRSLFLWLSILDFDDSSIHHCSTRPRLTERFPAFKTFVEAVLGASLSPQLNRFRLGLGGDMQRRIDPCCFRDGFRQPCIDACFPYVTPSQLNTWMCYPLTRHGIREIELCIHVSNHHCLLPPELFNCETLEILKLDVSLDLTRVCALPNFHLPKLKLLHLFAVLIPEDDLICKLVSSCPSLEELYVRGWFKRGDSIAVSSPSLRSLTLLIFERDNLNRTRKVLLIDTPNLQYLEYSDNGFECYSFNTMNALVKAKFDVRCRVVGANAEATFERVLYLVKAATNVEELALRSMCLGALDFDELNDRLPVFHNLKQLELSTSILSVHKWHTLLLGFLNHSPCLETLVFPWGISLHFMISSSEMNELDRRAFVTAKDIPSCCRSSLKRIWIGMFLGLERELLVLRFLLRHASVLEELVVSDYSEDVDQMLIHDMPRASATCTIKVGDSRFLETYLNL